MNDNVFILVIHVKGQEERRQFIQKQLDELGFPYEFVLDGNVSDLKPAIISRYFKDNMRCDTMYGAFARTSCAYKHILATQYILDHELPGALIVEDDLRLYDNFKEVFMRSMGEYKVKYANEPFIANYEESSLMLVPRSQRIEGQVLYKAARDRFAGCYYINRKAAQAIMDYVNENKSQYTSDVLHNVLTHNGVLSYYWSYPCIARQCSCDGSMPTMIPTKRRPLKRLKWYYKRVYKHLLYWLR